MRFLSMRKMKKRLPNSGVVAALDIGSSKVACGLARADPSGKLKLIGYGQQASRGLRAGVIVDMEALAASVAAAVHHAEEMADETIQEVLLSVSPTICFSSGLGIESVITGHAVDADDVRKMAAQACHEVEKPGHHVIHAIPTSYGIDDVRGIRDPKGMFGDKLGASIFIVGVPVTALRNLFACLEHCHLGISGFVASSYASGLACLVEDELDLGVTLIDMGAGTTSIAVFYDGKLHHIDSIGVGGAHVTGDIARGLSTPVIHAERLKTLYGSALSASSEDREKIVVPQIGEEDSGRGTQITRSELVRIIRPRIEETFELVRDRLRQSGLDKIAGKRMVLTGGASQMAGAVQLGNLILDKQGRLGKPLHLFGLDQGSRSPTFSTCAGLLVYGKTEQSPFNHADPANQNDVSKVFRRIGAWMRENL